MRPGLATRLCLKRSIARHSGTTFSWKDVIEHLINTRPRYRLTEPVSRDDVAFFLQMFSREPFGFVHPLPDDKYIVTMSKRVIASKLALLARSIESFEDSQ